jgi:hypothetical protein
MRNFKAELTIFLNFLNFDHFIIKIYEPKFDEAA